MIKKKIKRLYIMSEIWETVTQSQVFNWIKLVNQRDIESDCLSITTQKITNKYVTLQLKIYLLIKEII